MKSFLKNILTIGAGVALLTGCRSSKNVEEFTAWDFDRDHRVVAAEFDRGLRESRQFDRWDLDSDGELNDTEFARAAFTNWDAGGDGTIDAQEYARAMTAWYPRSATLYTLDQWDYDKDGSVSQLEFEREFFRTGIYRTWDGNRDGEIAYQEFVDGLYATWDQNQDGALDDVEFGSYYEYWN